MLSKQRLDLQTFKGLNTSVDPGFLPEGASGDLDNTWFYKGYLRRAPGSVYTDLTTTPPASSPGLPVVRIAPYYQAQVFQYYLVCVERSGGGNSIYSIGADGSWTLRATGTFSKDKSVRSYQMDDNLWLATLSQPLAYWTGSAMTTPADLAGVYARDLVSFYNHTLAGYTIESATTYRYRIKWSVFGDATDWSGTGSGYIDLDYTQGEFIGFGTLLDRLFVFKKDSVWEILYVGGDTVFSAQPVVNNVGCLATESIVSYNNLIYFLGSDNIYSFDGRTLTPIGDALQKSFFGFEASTSYAYLQNAKAVLIPSIQEYWLAVPRGASYPVDIFVYQLQEEAWWVFDQDEGVHALSYGQGLSGTTWEDIITPWTTETRTWDDSGLVNYLENILVGNDTSVLFRSQDVASELGVYKTAYWTTPHITFNWHTRWFNFTMEARGSAGPTLYYSTDEGSTWTSLGQQVPASTTEWNRLKWTFDFTCETVMFKVSLGDGTCECKRFRVVGQPREGER